MDLREFVVRAMADIEGALDEHLSKRFDDAIQSAPSKDDRYWLMKAKLMEKQQRLGDIAFDVAVTVGETTHREGKAGLGISVVDIGGMRSTERSHQEVSRIQFTIRAHKDPMESFKPPQPRT